jgi:hypothetical protein
MKMFKLACLHPAHIAKHRAGYAWITFIKDGKFPLDDPLADQLRTAAGASD